MKTIFIRIAQIALAFAVLSTLVAFCSTDANAMRHVKSPKRARPQVAFPPSREALLAQNLAINSLGLHRYRNDVDVQAGVKRGDLVPINFLNVSVLFAAPVKERYLRPQAAVELLGLANAYEDRFEERLILTSALRTQAFQFRLRRWNHNAATTRGPLASSHLAGTTFDVSRRRMTQEQRLWVEGYLTSLGDAVIVEEESGQMCFHIFVREAL